jgi:hypothetical protein
LFAGQRLENFCRLGIVRGVCSRLLFIHRRRPIVGGDGVFGCCGVGGFAHCVLHASVSAMPGRALSESLAGRGGLAIVRRLFQE